MLSSPFSSKKLSKCCLWCVFLRFCLESIKRWILSDFRCNHADKGATSNSRGQPRPELSLDDGWWNVSLVASSVKVGWGRLRFMTKGWLQTWISQRSGVVHKVYPSCLPWSSCIHTNKKIKSWSCSIFLISLAPYVLSLATKQLLAPSFGMLLRFRRS